MPTINGPFHSLFYPDYHGDRLYSDEDFGLPFKLDHSNGVYLNQSTQALQIAAAGDMNLTIRAGYCFIEGHFGGTPQDGSITLDNADGSYPRIDRIVMRHYGSGGQLDERKLAPLVLTGTPGQNPVPPDIVRNGTYYDLSLATVLVPAGAIEITAAHITDTRFDTSVCGAVTGKNENPLDTTELFAQFTALFEEMTGSQKAEFAALVKAWADQTAASQAEFDAFMGQLHDVMGENVATNLLNLVNGLRADVNENQERFKPLEVIQQEMKEQMKAFRQGMVGQIVQTARSAAPPGWLLCQGQALSRTEYADLFQAIGTAYGAGDGSTTFQIPDIRGRVPVGVAASGTFGGLNKKGGSETASAPVASHSHTVPSVGASGTYSYYHPNWDQHFYNNKVEATTVIPRNFTSEERLQCDYKITSINASGNGGSGMSKIKTDSATTGSTGSGGSHNNLQPYITVNYLIYAGV